MPIPQLDEHGLLPSGIYPCRLADAERRFSTDAHRAALWNNLLDVLRQLHHLDLAYPIYLAGGYFSDKASPEDIDLVHDLRQACGYNQYRGWRLFMHERERIHKNHNIDYCVNLPGGNDFSSFFQYIGPKSAALTGLHEKHKRGVLRIESRIWLDGLNK